MKEEEIIISPLKNKKIVVYPVQREGTWPPEGKDGSGTLFSGAFHEFKGVPEDSFGRKVDPLTKEEKDFCYSKESGLDIKEGDLSPYKKVNYWTKFHVKLTRDPLTLDLNNVFDWLKWKFLLMQKDSVAPSWDERKNKATYRFAIRDHEKDDEQTVIKIQKEKEVNRYFYKIENNPTQMKALLKMYYYSNKSNKRLPQDAAISFLSAELYSIINRDIDGLFNIIRDENFDTKLLIYESVDGGLIEKPTRTDYQIVGREEVLNLTDLVKFLAAKKNNDIKMQLQLKLEESK